jgi:hypothetical protein
MSREGSGVNHEPDGVQIFSEEAGRGLNFGYALTFAHGQGKLPNSPHAADFAFQLPKLPQANGWIGGGLRSRKFR